MIDRRAFIGAVGAACVVGVRMEAKKIQRLGMQLYTVRTEMEKDVDATLARVAALGYKEVEFAGYFKRTPAQIRDGLEEGGPDRTGRARRLSQPCRGQAAGGNRGRASHRTSLPGQPVDRRDPAEGAGYLEAGRRHVQSRRRRNPEGGNPVRVSQPPLRVRAVRRQAALRAAARTVRSETGQDGAGSVLDYSGREGSARLLQASTRAGSRWCTSRACRRSLRPAHPRRFRASCRA